MNNGRLTTKYMPAFLLICAISLFGCLAPPPVGVLINEPGNLDGYTFYGGANGGPVYVIDMEGNVIYQTSAVTNFGTKMLPGGSLLGPDFLVPHEQSNNAVVQIAWDGTEEWSYSAWENVPDWGWTARQHHDLQREGNPVGYFAPGQDFIEHGNTLILALADNFISAEVCGGERPVLDGIIYEVDWLGNKTFEWHGADHITEFGFNETDLGLLCSSARLGDYLHINTISRLGENHWYDGGDDRFHPQNIILDSRHHAWVIIIDHVTGNVVWRIGPYYSDGYPEASLAPIIGPHNAHMIPAGLPGEGNILLFDNGLLATFPVILVRMYSRVIEFNPDTLELVWEYSPGDDGTGDRLGLSPLISGVQRLPNGNTVITSGVAQQILEVTPDKEIVWEFMNDKNTNPGRSIYRSIRVPPQWLPEGENVAEYPDWPY